MCECAVQHGGPEHGDAQHGGPEHGETEHGDAQHGGPEHGGPEHGETEHGDAQHGEPEHFDAQHGQTKVSIQSRTSLPGLKPPAPTLPHEKVDPSRFPGGSRVVPKPVCTRFCRTFAVELAHIA